MGGQRPRHARRLLLTSAGVTLCSLFSLSAFIQQRTYAHSAHLELPDAPPSNPWVEAFLWLRQHTPTHALVALDANYTTVAGEDAQNARAWSERSTLPDYSKDGGAAADLPSLAPEWLAAAQAQTRLDTLPDAQRLHQLAPRHVSWLVLTANAPTEFQCPYSNFAVKVCRLPDVPSTRQPTAATSLTPSPAPPAPP